MIRSILNLVLIIFAFGFVGFSRGVYPSVKNESFTRGEVIHFKMTYGIFTIGKGSVKIHPNYFSLNNRDCFKVDIQGQTVGMVDWVADVDDQYGSYIDTAALVPHQFYRKVRQGRYKKDEWTFFDHIRNKIEVKTIDNATGKFRESKFYDAPPQVRDMIGGFLYLRNMDITKLSEGDTIVIPGFFEDEFYKMKIVYHGKKVIDVKAGKIRTIVFKPVMPHNKVFDGENSVTAFFSDDKNRIPVRIDADMFIGSAGVELTSYEGLKNRLNIVH